MIQSQITQMENELAESSFLDESNRPNPLLAATDKARNTAKALAVALNITGQGRKGINVKQKMSEDELAWAKVLDN